MLSCLWAAVYIAAVLVGSAGAESGKKTGPPEVGIDARSGQYIPLDLSFKDEQGKAVSLKDLIREPTILSLVYYRCPGICSPLLGGVADAIDGLPLKPGKDYNVLTVSFDPSDTPNTASEKRKNYLKLIHKPFPAEAWRFLTGDSDHIARLTRSVGFNFIREDNDFLHPAAVIVIAPDGKIIRYLYGTTFLPFDLQLALTEASQGRAGPSISRALLLCYSYNPKERKYVFQLTRVAGGFVLFFALALFVYLNVEGKIRKSKVR